MAARIRSGHETDFVEDDEDNALAGDDDGENDNPQEAAD